MLWLAKLRAMGWHGLASAGVALFSLWLVFYVWYPSPLASATGVDHLYGLMLLVDAALGPLLTFIVYRPGKRTLKFDLAVIALLQGAALVYGLHTVYTGRPAWLVYNVDRFDLVRVTDLDLRSVNQAKAIYRHPSKMGPQWVHAPLPLDIQQRNQYLFEEVMAGIAPSQRPQLYQPLATAAAAMQKRALPIEQLKKFNSSEAVEKILKSYPQANAYLPLKANSKDMTVLIVRQSNPTIVSIVDLRPW